jgi:hypothetical protein
MQKLYVLPTERRKLLASNRDESFAADIGAAHPLPDIPASQALPGSRG